MSFKIDISLPNVSKLNNDEYAQFVKGIVKLVYAGTIEKLRVEEELVTAIQENVELLTEASRQSRSTKESGNMAQLDKKRNEILSYLLSSFKVGKKSAIQSQKEAADILLLEFKNYRKVSTLPTRQKSQAVDALIKDLEKPEIRELLTTLGTINAVAPLKEINAKYQELLDVRAEKQLKNSSINVKKVRNETEELYRQLTRVVFAYNIINPSTETKNFISLLTKLIEDTMSANKQRLAQATPNRRGSKDKEKKAVSE